ncbi:MAG: 50S ribosomal protein L4 [Verrucomicrobiae bacterium]|nr:50S ribosomal protein L4 [Verrucomicrobiae bacterium]MCP5522793.1 50S ribosomal protein L4 [Verrucomicrobiales bacterium]
MKLTLRDQSGGNAGEVETGFDLVEGTRGQQAVHDVVVAYQAGQRSGTASAKTRSELSGSSKKPWRQKGTGRARAGTHKSPLWDGGAVVHGPRPRDFSKKVNKKTRNLALRKAITERLKAGDVILVQDIVLEAPRTKAFVAVLDALGVEGTVLVVQAGGNDNLLRSARNVAGVDVTTGDALNTYEVLRSDKIVFTLPAWERVQERLKQ